MESISRETLWDGLGLFFTGDAAQGTNSSSFLTGGGGSFFGVFPENGSMTTPHTLAQPRVRDAGLARAEIAVLSLILALTTLGNGFVLWVLLRRRKQNAPMHQFMVNLCVADLVVAFFQVSEIRGTGVGRRCSDCPALSTRAPGVRALLSRANEVRLQTRSVNVAIQRSVLCLVCGRRTQDSELTIALQTP